MWVNGEYKIWTFMYSVLIVLYDVDMCLHCHVPIKFVDSREVTRN